MNIHGISALMMVSLAAVGGGSAFWGQTKPPATRPAPAPKSPEVRLTLSLNGLRDAKVKSGDAVLVELAVSAPWGEDGPSAKVLSKPGGSWGDLVSIEVRGPNGTALPGFVARPLIRGEANIMLDAERSGWLAWVLESSGRTPIPSGEYKVHALLDALPGDAPNQKKTSSPPGRLTVSASPLSGDHARMSALAKIRVHSYRNELDQALSAARVAELAFPEDTLFIEEQGDALARKKQFAEAVQRYDLALSKVKAAPEDAVPEPPLGLLEKRRLAAAEAAKAGR